MNPGLRSYKRASLRVAIPEGLPEDMRAEVRELLSVHSDERGNGHAKALLHQVCAEADLEWQTLMIHVKPFDEGLTAEQLERFYASHGFKRIQDEPVVLMARSPEMPKVAYG